MAIGPPISISGYSGKKDGGIGREWYGVFYRDQGHTTAGTYSCYSLCMGQRFRQKGVSGRLLGLLPIRSTDEGTEKSEDGELLTN